MGERAASDEVAPLNFIETTKMVKRPNDGTMAASVSRPNQVTVVWENVIRQMRRCGYPRRDVFGVQLALEEALTNAINHGHRHDYSKEARVEWAVDENRVWISIEDQGDGFSHSSVCDPTLPENVHLPGGRGLLFMRTYMCSLEYNEKGNCVTMVKNRTRNTAPDPC